MITDICLTSASLLNMVMVLLSCFHTVVLSGLRGHLNVINGISNTCAERSALKKRTDFNNNS